MCASILRTGINLLKTPFIYPTQALAGLAVFVGTYATSSFVHLSENFLSCTKFRPLQKQLDLSLIRDEQNFLKALQIKVEILRQKVGLGPIETYVSEGQYPGILNPNMHCYGCVQGSWKPPSVLGLLSPAASHGNRLLINLAPWALRNQEDQDASEPLKGRILSEEGIDFFLTKELIQMRYKMNPSDWARLKVATFAMGVFAGLGSLFLKPSHSIGAWLLGAGIFASLYVSQTFILKAEHMAEMNAERILGPDHSGARDYHAYLLECQKKRASGEAGWIERSLALFA